MIRKLTRVWINAPSTLQPDHKEHGRCVLADLSQAVDGGGVVIHYLEGPVMTRQILESSLSLGWPDHLCYPDWRKNDR